MESFGTIAGRCAAAVCQLLPGCIWRKYYFYTKTYFMQMIFLVRLGSREGRYTIMPSNYNYD